MGQNLGIAALAIVSVAACDGGGGGPAPPPAPSPSATPTPSPTPTPTPLVTCAAAEEGTEQWPAWAPGTTYAAEVQRVSGLYNAGHYDWRDYQLSGDYTFDGQYVTISPFDPVGPETQFNAEGVPQVLVSGVWRYNPVTISNFALWHHTRLVKNGIALPPEFWAAVAKLRQMTGPDGAIRYDYAFDTMRPGWTSAMAQGMVLSVFARAYVATPDPALIEQGNLILEFMLTPASEGGNRGSLADLDPSLSDYVLLDEYDPSTSAHTLNGFMFAMFGLYDWAKLGEQVAGPDGLLARDYFNCTVHTVASTLHYYDIGGFSVYDLDHVLDGVQPSADPGYHRIHIAQLVALYSITGRPELLHWARNWAPSTQPVPY